MREYIEAWNAHDLERVLSHWADECVFTSPWVADLVGEPSASLHTKEALRSYWTRALERAPQLRFDDPAVFVGHDSVVITFRNHRGKSCAEWIQFGPDGRAVRGAAQYLGGR